MRVLRTKGSESPDWVPQLCTHRGQPYAILSHRWFEDANHEVLFTDIEQIDQIVISTQDGSDVSIIKNPQYAGGFASSKPAFKKVQGAAQQARSNSYDYVWIDTCCVDKNSSAELSEAINSMFKWYKAAKVCYAYLADVSDAADTSHNSQFAASDWWKRGWTLQELLAPSRLTFFTSDWRVIGHKHGLSAVIANIAGINADLFTGRELESFSVAQRMSWASGRKTTRPEDTAYCLMGLFDVHIPVLYGEGEKAFLRLQQEIIKELDDESIFAWRDEPALGKCSGMLATRPAAFAGSSDIECEYCFDHKTLYNVTNKGLSITLPLYHAAPSSDRDGNLCIAWLRCISHPSNRYIGIFLKRLSSNGIQYARWESQLWIKRTEYQYHEATSIFVKQSWEGFLGHWGIMHLRDDEELAMLEKSHS